MLALARHSLLDLHGCAPELLRDADAIKPVLMEAVRKGQGTIVTEIFHNFSPHGVSGMIVIAESHVAIHTWPEHGYAAVDIFSCSASLDHGVIERAIAEGLRCSQVSSRVVERGRAGAA